MESEVIKIDSFISKNGAIVTLTKLKEKEKYHRAIQLSQFDIFTATHEATTFSDLQFNDGDIVYCVPNSNGMIEIIENIDDLKFFVRIVEKVRLNDKDAFTLIVSKTIHQPEYNIEKENQQIKNYLNGKYLKWDWDFKFS
jgi:hypothetical protein